MPKTNVSKGQSTKKKGRSIPKKYVPIVKGMACERHAFHDIAAFFGTTSDEIEYIVFGNEFDAVPALRTPNLPVLKYADIVYVAEKLDAAIKMLDNDQADEARRMIVRAAEIVNAPSIS